MNQYINQISQKFTEVIKILYKRKNPNENYAEFDDKLQDFMFCVYDEIYRELQTNKMYKINTNLSSRFENTKNLSLSNVIENHFIDIFCKNLNDTIGQNMNIVIFGNEEYSKIIIQGYHNGKKYTFRELEVFNKTNEPTK